MEAVCKALGACCASSTAALVSLRFYALSPLETDNRVLHLAAKILCAARFVPPNCEDLYRSLHRQIGYGMVITFALSDSTECVSHVEICRDGTETLRQRAVVVNPGAMTSARSGFKTASPHSQSLLGAPPASKSRFDDASD